MSLEIRYPNARNNPWINDLLEETTRVRPPMPYELYKERVSHYLNFRKVAEEIIGKAINLPENVNLGKSAGCLVLLTNDNGNLVDLYGKSSKLDPDFTTKEEKFAFFALNKAFFLRDNPDCISSRQNMNLDSSKQSFIQISDKKVPVPEGGIRLPNGDILAFSGFAGYIDEAICIAIGLKSGLLDYNQAEQISKIGKFESFLFALRFIEDNSLSPETKI